MGLEVYSRVNSSSEAHCVLMDSFRLTRSSIPSRDHAALFYTIEYCASGKDLCEAEKTKVLISLARWQSPCGSGAGPPQTEMVGAPETTPGKWMS